MRRRRGVRGVPPRAASTATYTRLGFPDVLVRRRHSHARSAPRRRRRIATSSPTDFPRRRTTARTTLPRSACAVMLVGHVRRLGAAASPRRRRGSAARADEPRDVGGDVWREPAAGHHRGALLDGGCRTSAEVGTSRARPRVVPRVPPSVRSGSMAVVETRTNLWSVLAGRPPAPPVQPTDADVWQLVVQRLNPAKARPVLRDGVEEAHLTSLRGQPYVMLRSPDREGCYLRLTPDEVELAHRMDGTRTVAALVGELARISGRLAPEQVTRTRRRPGGQPDARRAAARRVPPARAAPAASARGPRRSRNARRGAWPADGARRRRRLRDVPLSLRRTLAVHPRLPRS